LIQRASLARTTEDWQNLAKELGPVFAGVLNGEIKASAAQASMLKDVYNRAYGKPVATQTEKRVASGVIVLPALDSGSKMMICPKCGYDVGYEAKNLVVPKSGAADSVPVIDS